LHVLNFSYALSKHSPGLDKKNVEVQAILGPTTSMQANFVIDLGEKLSSGAHNVVFCNKSFSYFH
jgi:hypothetical protein